LIHLNIQQMAGLKHRQAEQRLGFSDILIISAANQTRQGAAASTLSGCNGRLFVRRLGASTGKAGTKAGTEQADRTSKHQWARLTRQ
jgi:hypothetical protein